MWVQMLEFISGGRPDGTSWPSVGATFEVEDWEGQSLIRGQLARRVVNPNPSPPPAAHVAPASDKPEAAEVPEPEVVPAQPEPATAAAEASPVETLVAQTASENPPPAPADPKAAWVAYAVSRGTSPEEAAGLTKAQLQSAFGGRL